MITIPQPAGRNRLSDLLLEPREALDIEIKSWLDPAGNNEHKAILAKALLALANHGGGFVIIGLTETDTGTETARQSQSLLSGCRERDRSQLRRASVSVLGASRSAPHLKRYSSYHRRSRRSPSSHTREA